MAETHLECTLSDADLFTPPFTQSDIQHGVYEDVFPISKLDDNGPIEFNIGNSTDKLIDLASTYLRAKIQIQNLDGSVLEDVVVPVNYIFGSMFSQVDVSLGGTNISNSNNTYAYRAYLETLLNYGADAKSSQLQMGLYKKDSIIENLNPAQNLAIAERIEHFKESRVVEVSGRIHSDIFHQERLLLNGIPLKITLHRNKAGFMLLTNVDALFKFLITEAVLCVRKVQLTQHKFIEIQKNLERVPALFPINRIDVRTHSVAAGLSSLIWDNIYQGQLPNRIFVGMVDNDSFTGSFKKSPFNFKHYNVNKVGCFVNGETLPGQPLNLNFDRNHYLEGYRSLFTTAGKINRDEGIDIARREYKTGYTLFGFDISPSTCNGGHQEAVKRGTLRLQLEFQKALPNTITVILYADFDNTISIDKFRNIIKDF